MKRTTLKRANEIVWTIANLEDRLEQFRESSDNVIPEEDLLKITTILIERMNKLEKELEEL